ncbi:MAG: hypothetical protein NC293_02660 [Roseburia sp.]|nr:hypothetical protein [Roseburia sp.]
MSVNGISNSQAATYSQTSSVTTKTEDKKQSEAVSSAESTGVVYEPSGTKDSTDANSKVQDYSSVVKKLKSGLSSKNQQLQNLVDQLLSKQAKKYTSLSQLFTDIKNGNVSVDPSVVSQAQKDIADDGYWGVEQTSDRMVSMAQALSEGDPEKADKMIAAIKKGYEQAAKAWGGELPDICQKTIDAATKKLESWRDGLSAED